MAAVYLAACGTPSSISGSSVKSATMVAAPDAVEVADSAKHSPAAPEVSRPVAPVSHPADRLRLTPVSRPVAPPPVADADRGTPGFNCQGGSPGKPKLMCAPQ